MLKKFTRPGKHYRYSKTRRKCTRGNLIENERCLTNRSIFVRIAIVTIALVGLADAHGIALAASAPAYSWTGFYVGANIGYGWGSEPIQVSGDAAQTLPALIVGVLPRKFADSPNGVIGGGQIGYNYEIRPLVLGTETDLQGSDISDRQRVLSRVNGFFPFDTNGSQKLDLFGTVRGRVGFTLIDPLLIYFTGGFAYGHVKLSNSAINPGCVGICTTGTTSNTKGGWTIGTGLEYAVSTQWSVKTEYLHYDLGTISQTLTDTGGGFAGVFQKYSADFSGNIVRVGLNYKFGGP